MTERSRPPAQQDIKPRRQSWRLDIQGMRGLTMIVIVLFHAGLPIPGGFVSLDAFFVISGFVISGMLDREFRASGTISLRGFYLRRFKRLTPALVTTLVIVVLLSALLLSPIDTQVVTAQTALGATYLAANVVVQVTSGGYFDLSADLNPLLHTWSLSLEEQFYLIFPLLLFIGWLLSRRYAWPRGTAVSLLAVMGTASLLLAVLPVAWLPAPLQSPALLGYYSPLVRTWEFAAGALLFFATKRLRRVSDRTGLMLGLAGLALFFAPMWLIDSSVRYPGPWTLVPVAGTLLLLLAGFAHDNPISRALASRGMVFTGDRSYSWYLWHWPVIVFAVALFPTIPGVALMAAALSILPALASYNWVENPLRHRKMSDRSISKLTLGLVSASTAAALVVLISASQSWGNARIEAVRTVVASDHLAQASGCHVFDPLEAAEYDECWLERGPGSPLMLVGDSNADHFSEALTGAGHELGRSVSVTSASDCPFIDQGEMDGTMPTTERCAIYYERTMQWLAGQADGTVIISTSGAQYQSPSQVDDYRRGLESTSTQLQRLGHQVVIVQPIPRIPVAESDGKPWDPRGCSMASVLTEGCRVDWALSASASTQQAIWDANDATAEATGASTLWLGDVLCPAGKCSTQRDSEWIYRDFNHLTVSGSKSLTPEFRAHLSEVSPDGR